MVIDDIAGLFKEKLASPKRLDVERARNEILASNKISIVRETFASRKTDTQYRVRSTEPDSSVSISP